MAPIYLLLFTIVIQAFAASGCFETERNALLAFKADLIDPRNRLASWKSQNCCAWKGVVCSNTTGHILKLNLRNSYDNIDYFPYGEGSSALGGKISPSLLLLNHLEHLDLSLNNFSEIRIPEYFGSLKNLRFGGNLQFALCESTSLLVLDISNNKLSGEIPSCLGMLQDQLLVLDMMNNNLTGKVPTSLGKLGALAILDLSNNSLSGEIPSSLQYCTQSFRNTYFSAIDRMYDRLYVAVALTLIRLRRRCGQINSGFPEKPRSRVGFRRVSDSVHSDPIARFDLFSCSGTTGLGPRLYCLKAPCRRRPDPSASLSADRRRPEPPGAPPLPLQPLLHPAASQPEPRPSLTRGLPARSHRMNPLPRPSPVSHRPSRPVAAALNPGRRRPGLQPSLARAAALEPWAAAAAARRLPSPPPASGDPPLSSPTCPGHRRRWEEPLDRALACAGSARSAVAAATLRRQPR
ncbi:Receptor-like protein 12 [Ananas comosus]|uniref:Receptor-like protein 12 n=1 Tax=Ananas comosus TaxID=4615 RepID=A0A199UKN2_ANACO|nr:Receptor-like protein 12 [Ananas comosus]